MAFLVEFGLDEAGVIFACGHQSKASLDFVLWKSQENACRIYFLLYTSPSSFPPITALQLYTGGAARALPDVWL
jgi:1-acyl-sn-glycerol-3-phosphate acyltransferase